MKHVSYILAPMKKELFILGFDYHLKNYLFT